MSSPTGRLSRDELRARVESGAIDTVLVILTDHYGRFMVKRFDARLFLDDGLEPAGWYLEDYHALQRTREEPFTAAVRRHLRDSGVPLENSKGEWGLGQHELNVRYADVLGVSVTFMASIESAYAHFDERVRVIFERIKLGFAAPRKELGLEA